MNCYAHTIVNAARSGLILAGEDEYGTPEWLGTEQQHRMFGLLESNPELL